MCVCLEQILASGSKRPDIGCHVVAFVVANSKVKRHLGGSNKLIGSPFSWINKRTPILPFRVPYTHSTTIIIYRHVRARACSAYILRVNGFFFCINQLLCRVEFPVTWSSNQVMVWEQRIIQSKKGSFLLFENESLCGGAAVRWFLEVNFLFQTIKISSSSSSSSLWSSKNENVATPRRNCDARIKENCVYFSLFFLVGTVSDDGKFTGNIIEG